MNPWERDIWKYFMEIASMDQLRRQPRSQGLSSPSGGAGGGGGGRETQGTRFPRRFLSVTHHFYS